MITSEGLKYSDSKWAFLNPNKPDSTNMNCIVCRTDFGFIREYFVKIDYKENVKYLLEDDGATETWVCLTCWNEEIKKHKYINQ